MLLLGAFARGQNVALRINELQASNSRIFLPGTDLTPDWIELFNPGKRAVDLQGMRLVLGGKQHQFEHSLTIPPLGLVLLWCDGQPTNGPEHIGFTLPKTGGTLMLIGADGRSILDSFTWKDLPSGVSMARMPNGARSWGYATEPSPGAANPSHAQRTQRLGTPTLAVDPMLPGRVRISAQEQEGSILRYTTDGTPVTEHTGSIYTGPIELAPGSVLRYGAFSPTALPSAQGLSSTPFHAHTLPVTSIALDPRSLHGDSVGIDTPGLFANHTRRGLAWEREALMQYNGGDAVPLGLRVSGSGSRGLAKRSFKLHFRDRYNSPEQGFAFPDGTHFKEAILRADASPHSFLRNSVIEALVHQHGLALDIQPSTSTVLYINGQYRGLYRLLPPKDANWAKVISGAEAVDLLAGAGHGVRSGSAAHFIQAREALFNGAPVDSLMAMLDLNSLVDLACVDLWTGRLDHDINVRCYRPREQGGRWRWILYDMDLWSPVEMNTVSAHCAEKVPDAPYIPVLLEHPTLQHLLLARMTTLQATAFAPANAIAVADSIHAVYRNEMLRDHARWDLELEPPQPDLVLQSMQRFIAERPQHQMAHLAERCGRQLHSITIEVPNRTMGSVRLNGSVLPPGKQQVLCFSGVRMELEATPNTGYGFVGWKGRQMNDAKVSLDLSEHQRLRVQFKPESRSVNTISTHTAIQ